MITRRQWLSTAALASASALAAGEDPLRPRFHFMPPKNWMNDPNGLIQLHGVYHLFYQYNPNGAYWGDMHWGHATSNDLVHWRHLPVALAPIPGGPDKDGVFSGCCRLNNGVPTIFYTGVSPETQNVITANGTLTEFQRSPANPVIAHPPSGLAVTAFRDPFVWREGDEWMMAIGSGLKDGNGTVLLYNSTDLAHWTYLHPLATAARPEDGIIWECPNFFPLRDKWVLFVSADHPIRKPFYWTGRYENRRFIAEKMGSLDDGGYFYAPQTFLDERGRRLVLGWIPEGRTVDAQKAAGWAGAQSVPRLLDLDASGRLVMKPIPEFTSLRGRKISKPEDLRGDSFEISAQFAATDKPIAIELRASPDGRERTFVTYTPATRELAIDRRASSLSRNTERDPHTVTLPPGGPLHLRIFLDRSIVEVYANETVCLTSRIYPTLPASLGFKLNDREFALHSFDAWEISPA